MKRILVIAVLALSAAAGFAMAQAPDRLERRVQHLEETVARLEKRLADLEAKLAGGERRGMMGGGGMMGRGGMMGGGQPNEQWRSPESGR
ncbi:MAG: hypothetical protein ACREUN_13360 [Burkholderiales bacterium]